MKKKREEALKDIAKTVQAFEKELDEQFHAILATKKEKHILEVEYLKRKLKGEEEKSDILKGNIVGMEMKEKHVILNRENTLHTFKEFIRSTKGMSEKDANITLVNITS